MAQYLITLGIDLCLVVLCIFAVAGWRRDLRRMDAMRQEMERTIEDLRILHDPDYTPKPFTGDLDTHIVTQMPTRVMCPNGQHSWYVSYTKENGSIERCLRCAVCRPVTPEAGSNGTE